MYEEEEEMITATCSTAFDGERSFCYHYDAGGGRGGMDSIDANEVVTLEKFNEDNVATLQAMFSPDTFKTLAGMIDTFEDWDGKQRGCYCEHDCCGCISYSVDECLQRKDGSYLLIFKASMNY